MKRFTLTVSQKSAEGKVGHAVGEDIEALQKAERRSNRVEDFPDAERLVRRLVAQELTLSFVPEAEQRHNQARTEAFCSGIEKAHFSTHGTEAHGTLTAHLVASSSCPVAGDPRRSHIVREKK